MWEVKRSLRVLENLPTSSYGTFLGAYSVEKEKKIFFLLQKKGFDQPPLIMEISINRETLFC